MSLQLAIGLLLASIIVCKRLQQRRKPSGAPPTWPLLGMLPSLFYHLHNAYDWSAEVLIRCGGTFTFKGPWLGTGWFEAVVTAEPANVEYVLKTRFPSFPKGRIFKSAFRDLLGDGIFNTDDASWKAQRQRTVAHLHAPALRKRMVQSVEELVGTRLLPLLDDAALRGAVLDLQDVLLRFTFDNICAVGLGLDLACLSAGLPRVPFAGAFEEAAAASAFRFVVGPCIWEAMKYFGIGTEGRLKRALKPINEFAAAVIAQKRKEAEAASLPHQSTVPLSPDLLSLLMQDHQRGIYSNEDGRPYSDKFLRDFCINLILAGRDTSSVALAWFFWLLMYHPRVEEKILLEIKSILEKSGRRSSPSVEDVKQMHYLHAALSESLRLYPSVPVDFKAVRKDDVLPDGTSVKRGAWLVYSMYAMGRMEHVWGADCGEFKPERWIKEGVFVSESAYKYPAFNAGPRLCLGKDFAYVQMKWVAASILWRYRLEMVPGHIVAPKLAPTLYMKYGLRVVLHARGQQTT